MKMKIDWAACTSFGSREKMGGRMVGFARWGFAVGDHTLPNPKTAPQLEQPVEVSESSSSQFGQFTGLVFDLSGLPKAGPLDGRGRRLRRSLPWEGGCQAHILAALQRPHSHRSQAVLMPGALCTNSGFDI